MTAQQGEYERIAAVLEQADEPMTAREILDAIGDAEIDSAHRVATVLGRRAKDGSVDVIREQPYRYRMEQ
jgi:predicted Zn-ribbon and HTH transcriptional regulator